MRRGVCTNARALVEKHVDESRVLWGRRIFFAHRFVWNRNHASCKKGQMNCSFPARPKANHLITHDQIDRRLAGLFSLSNERAALNAIGGVPSFCRLNTFSCNGRYGSWSITQCSALVALRTHTQTGQTGVRTEARSRQHGPPEFQRAQDARMLGDITAA